jgi:hypothetical protein
MTTWQAAFLVILGIAAALIMAATLSLMVLTSWYVGSDFPAYPWHLFGKVFGWTIVPSIAAAGIFVNDAVKAHRSSRGSEGS